MEISAVGSSYQKTGKDTADWEDLVRATVNCRLQICELLWLLVITGYEWSINPITNPNSVHSHPYT
jgi:hypothetical protein